MLVDASRSGLLEEIATLDCAARWNTSEGFSFSNIESKASEVMSPCMKTQLELMFFSCPELRSSTTITLLPEFSSSSTKWDPIKPAPPVTSAVFSLAINQVGQLLFIPYHTGTFLVFLLYSNTGRYLAI